MLGMRVLQRVHNGDGCNLASTLCRYDLRKGDLYVLKWTSEAGRYHFRAANVWWRCAQYFVIVSCDWIPRNNRYMYMAYVSFYVYCMEVCWNVV